MEDDAPYLLLTPGPLTTSPTVKQAMLRDVSTWDGDYHAVVQEVRAGLVALAVGEAPTEQSERKGMLGRVFGSRSASDAGQYTAVLMQGSGTFAVEATLGTVIPSTGRLLVLENGAYGARMLQIAERLGIDASPLAAPETEPVDIARVERRLLVDKEITHVAMVHCETTTGMLNPAAEVGGLARKHRKTFILDAMSSFGGIPMTMEGIRAQFLISSANKCIQGVPGFAFVIAERTALEAAKGQARSLSLDLYEQWREMEEHGGKWRYTSPTHTVLAFAQALRELREEGGVDARYQRYRENARRLVDGMARTGFETLLPAELRSPIITSFRYPDAAFDFPRFYDAMKRRGFVIYPGKVSQADTFRIGTIGHVFPDDIDLLGLAVEEAVQEMAPTKS